MSARGVLEQVRKMVEAGAAKPVAPASPRHGSRPFAWAVAALISAGPVVTAMLIWVLIEVLHGAWPLKLEIVLKRLDIVGTAVIGLLAMLGIVVLAVVVAAIRANIAGGIGMANFSITSAGDDAGQPTPVAQVTTTTTVAPAPAPTSDAG